VRGLDAIEGTKIIDIKPYIPRLDLKNDANSGWTKGKLKI
jgi:tRNA (Thr-GGU) A37 N-methylase